MSDYPECLLVRGDARRSPIASGSVQCVCTSPPYFGLRDYQCPGQIGLEASPAAFVAAMVGVFREVRRVLRDDGVCWLNLGDSYANDGKWGGATSGKHVSALHGEPIGRGKRNTGLKSKDLIGIPWLVAFALRADGWYLRSDCIWHKPNPMPESVTDRPTKAHEYVFLLTKRDRYFYDADAIKEKSSHAGMPAERVNAGKMERAALGEMVRTRPVGRTCGYPENRNARSVWRIPMQPFEGAHFATFPEQLPEKCIKAGTSERGCCPACGSPWVRVTERTAMVLARSQRTHSKGRTRSSGTMLEPPTCKTVGWEPSCGCPAHDPVPCTVHDPFSGAATTGLVALRLGRRYVGTDLSADYLTMSQRRIADGLRPRSKLDPAPVKPLPGQLSFLTAEAP